VVDATKLLAVDVVFVDAADVAKFACDARGCSKKREITSMSEIRAMLLLPCKLLQRFGGARVDMKEVKDSSVPPINIASKDLGT